MSETTVVEEIAALRQRGYTGDFGVTDDRQVRCGGCSHVHRPDEIEIETTARFEGASDPDDEAIVFGVRCRACAAMGVLVAAYGPSASAEEAAVITALVRWRRP